MAGSPTTEANLQRRQTPASSKDLILNQDRES